MTANIGMLVIIAGLIATGVYQARELAAPGIDVEIMVEAALD